MQYRSYCRGVTVKFRSRGSHIIIRIISHALFVFNCSSEHLTLSVLPVISPDDPNIPDLRSRLNDNFNVADDG